MVKKLPERIRKTAPWCFRQGEDPETPQRGGCPHFKGRPCKDHAGCKHFRAAVDKICR